MTDISFPCPRSCGKTFGSIEAAAQHARDTSKCCACGKMFGSPDAAEQHFEAVHGEAISSEDDEHEHICRACGKAFGSAGAVEQHFEAKHCGGEESSSEDDEHGHAPPPGYVCHKCNVPGHFISECEHGGRGRGGGGGGYRGGGGYQGGGRGGRRGVCFDFQHGVCSRGDSCRFSHGGGGGGGGGPITSEHDHAVPFPDAAGRWVARKDFPRNRRKSFGMFECHRCSKTWSSAHTQPLYRQGCKNCDDFVLPCCMWLNPPGDTRESDDDDSRAPHDHERCEACRAGVCTAG